MSVQKSVELIGTGSNVEEAVAEAVDRAAVSLEGITSFEIDRIEGVLEGAKVTYRVRLRLFFTLMERLHG
jgi:flavin-binding protein dodecin